MRDRGAGRGVASGTGRDLFGLEFAKAREINFLAGNSGVSDGFQNVIDNSLGDSLGQALRSGQLFDEIGGVL